MTVAQGKLAEILIYSVFLGVFFGVVYDFFRIRRRFFSLASDTSGTSKRRALAEVVIVFFEDVVYLFFCSVVMCIFVYYTNSGRLRGVAFVGTGVGFYIYYKTFGRLVMCLAGYVLSFLKKTLRKLFKCLVMPVMRLLYKLYKLTLGKIFDAVYTQFIEFFLLAFSAKGFGILKKRERKKYEKANKHIREGSDLRVHSVLHGNHHKDAV